MGLATGPEDGEFPRSMSDLKPGGLQTVRQCKTSGVFPFLHT